jgi:hypothetical protein
MSAREHWSSDSERGHIEKEAYPGDLKVQIAFLTARARLHDSEAMAKLAHLGRDKDPRTRKRVLESRLQAGVGQRQALLVVALKDSDPRVREAALLNICSAAPSECEQLVPMIACCLAEKLDRLRLLASEAIRLVATRNEELLGSIHRFLSSASSTPPPPPSTRKQASRKSAPQHGLEVRRAALQALLYPHASRSTQVALLDFWDRREYELDEELFRTLCYCPDLTAIAEELQGRLNRGPSEEALRALRALAALKLEDLRPTFLRYVESEDLPWLKAAIEGLAPIAQPADGEVLERVCDRLRPYIYPLETST